MRTISQILAAGIAITAFSLLLYSLSFNLKDRVTRSFTLILIGVVIIFTAEAIGSTTSNQEEMILMTRLQWVGLVLIPPAYFQFSDALLETTGRPSKGKRKWANRISYAASAIFFVLIPLHDLLITLTPPVVLYPQERERSLITFFTVYYIVSMVATSTTFIRSRSRTTTPTTRRRMTYLVVGAIAPAIGFVPYLFGGSTFAAEHNLVYWTTVMVCNLFTGGLIVIMAYSVSFFGVNWPDRVIKRRLFKWMMRGPVTAIVALGVTTVLRRFITNYNLNLQEWIPISMILAILLMEYAITIFSPVWEEKFFYGNDREEIALTTDLADRMMTHNDLIEFLETVIAAISDRFRAYGVWIATVEERQLKLMVKTGDIHIQLDHDLLLKTQDALKSDADLPFFYSDACFLVPLSDGSKDQRELAGLLGIHAEGEINLEPENLHVLQGLIGRIESALRSREMQSTINKVVQNLNPQFEQFQILRAETRFANAEELAEKMYEVPPELSNLVKDALTHYWGGPKLSENPLIQLTIVQNALGENDQNTVNALRSILKQAIEKIRPEGERKFTGEWVLYNIIDLKFIQGKKVREVANRLALSEADLYRKQRIAIEAVAKAIVEMENHSSDH